MYFKILCLNHKQIVFNYLNYINIKEIHFKAAKVYFLLCHYVMYKDIYFYRLLFLYLIRHIIDINLIHQ